MIERTKKVCLECQSEGNETCAFALLAAALAASPHLSPLEKHQQIATARIEAREKSCPHLNDIDPDYPGRSSL